MRRALILSLAIVMGLSLAASAGKIGVGARGGMLFPIVQEDQGDGGTFGIKVRARLSGPFAIEPNLNFASYGDADISGIGTRTGSSLTHYGIDITVGGGFGNPGLKPLAFIGGALYNTKRDGDDTTNKSGWSLGGGFALGLIPNIDIDLRGRVHIVGAEESTSKKAWKITAGAVYFFGKE